MFYRLHTLISNSRDLRRRLTTRLVQNAFLKSSSIIFVVNLTVAAINYSVPVIVRHITAKEFFPSWIALNSTVAITMVVFTALQAEFTKKTSSLASCSQQAAIAYLRFMQRGLLKTFVYAIPFLPILIYIIYVINPAESWLLAGAIVGNLFVQAYAVLHSSFLLGLLKLKDFSINLIVATLSRPIITVLLLLAGLGLYALPLGYLFFALVMLSHAFWVINKQILTIQPNLDISAIAGVDVDPLSLRREIWSTVKTMVAFFSLSAFLNSPAIIAERILPDGDKDLFAVLFTFGQIMHFGAIAFLGTLVAYSAKGKNLKIYLAAIAAVSLITLAIGATFWLFGPILLLVMNSPEYVSQIPTILYFALFIALYNALFVSMQYLISLNQHQATIWLSICLALQVWLLFSPNVLGQSTYNLPIFITVNIVCALLAGLIIGIQIIWEHRAKAASLLNSTQTASSTSTQTASPTGN